MNSKETFTVYSSWGNIIACKKTGCVLEVNAESFEKKKIINHKFEYVEIDYCYLDDIQKFFIEEYIAFYGKLHNGIDIICIGYWDDEYNYTPPESDRRYFKDYQGK